MYCFPQEDAILTKLQPDTDIASSNSSALTVVRHNVNENAVTLQELLRTIRGFASGMNSSIQNRAGLFSHGATLILFDAIGRVLPGPDHLTGSFDVSRSIGAKYLGLFC
jgi:hypothetical protein